jgi:hypothetical protein
MDKRKEDKQKIFFWIFSRKQKRKKMLLMPEPKRQAGVLSVSVEML